MKKSLLTIILLFVCGITSIHAETKEFYPKSGAELKGVLDEAQKEANNHNQSIVHLSNATYELDDDAIFGTNINCNFYMTGPTGYTDGTLPVILLKDSVGEDDKYFGFGDSEAKENRTLNVRLENFRVEYAYDKPHDEYMIFKFCNVNGITMRNVEVVQRVSNSITCVDFRHCDDVDIEGCTFVNYQGEKFTDELGVGGCLWLRTGCRNVSIRNNVLKKSGNDEALCFFYRVESNGATWKNISVTGNTIEYSKRSDGKSLPIDLLIGVHSYSKNPKGDFSTWENFDFSNNIVKCEDVVGRIFDVHNFKSDNFINVKVHDNTFIRNYASDAVTFVGGTSIDFAVKEDVAGNENSVRTPIEIYNNQILLNHSLKYSKEAQGHQEILNDGSSVKFYGNTVDGRNLQVTGAPDTFDEKRFILCHIDNHRAETEIFNNKLLNMGFLSTTNSNKNICDARLSVRDNHITGDCRSYWNEMAGIDYIFAGNICEDTGWLLLFQSNKLGKDCSFTVTDNLFSKKASVAEMSGSMGYFTSPQRISRLVFTGNTLYRYGSGVLNTGWLTPDTPTLVTDNTLSF